MGSAGFCWVGWVVLGGAGFGWALLGRLGFAG